MNLKETISLWNKLEDTEKPIVLYGMGNGADKILDELGRRNISAAGVFASDEFCRGQQFRGFQVVNYAQAKERFAEMVVLVAFGTQLPEVISRVKRIAEEQELYVPDVPVVGGRVFDSDFLDENIKRFEEAYGMLGDDFSRRTFCDMVDYKISGKPEYLFDCECSVDSVYSEVLSLTEHEAYVDVGAYTGDTVREFIGYAGGYDYIYAIEPDQKNFAKLLKNTQAYDRIDCFHLAAHEKQGNLGFSQRAGRNSACCGDCGGQVEANSLDSLLSGQRITYIKLDVEGQELAVLKGAGQIIRQQKPKLLVSAYHRNEDLFEIPQLLKRLREDYRVYLRHYPYIPAWDTNYYFV